MWSFLTHQNASLDHRLDTKWLRISQTSTRCRDSRTIGTMSIRCHKNFGSLHDTRFVRTTLKWQLAIVVSTFNLQVTSRMNALQRFIELVPFAFWDHFAIKLTEIPDQMEPVSTPGPNLLKFYKYKNLVNLQLQQLPVSFHIKADLLFLWPAQLTKDLWALRISKASKNGPKMWVSGSNGKLFIFPIRLENHSHFDQKQNKDLKILTSSILSAVMIFHKWVKSCFSN